MAENSILDYAWLVTATSNGQAPLMAGALCVHEDGLLLTVTHGIQLFDLAKPAIKVKAYNGSDMDATIVYTNAGKAFGITLLQVSKPDGQKFKYIEFSDDLNMSLDAGTKILACIHDMHHAFNLENGLICCNFPGNLRVPPNIFGPFTFPSSTSSPIRTIGSVATMATVGSRSGSISNKDEIRKMVGNSAFETCALLNQSVPLIQVSGLGFTMFDGQCGCPVFTKKCIKLLGLFFLSTVYNQFIIPARVLKQVFEEGIKDF